MFGIPFKYSTHGPYQYRLGDMVLEGSAYRNSSGGRNIHYKNFPNSIATEYMKTTDVNNRYDILSDIVQRKTGNDSNLKPPIDMLLIHLRLGDVIDRTKYSVDDFLNNSILFNDRNYVKPLSYYKDILNRINEYEIKTVMLVGGFHKPLTSTKKSIEYMHKIKDYFESHHIKVYERLGKHDADEDFIYMCNAEYYTPGGGGFSNLVRGVVCFRGKHIVSDNKNSTAECDVEQ
jgi:hypothetical protein